MLLKIRLTRDDLIIPAFDTDCTITCCWLIDQSRLTACCLRNLAGRALTMPKTFVHSHRFLAIKSIACGSCIYGYGQKRSDQDIEWILLVWTWIWNFLLSTFMPSPISREIWIITYSKRCSTSTTLQYSCSSSLPTSPLRYDTNLHSKQEPVRIHYPVCQIQHLQPSQCWQMCCFCDLRARLHPCWRGDDGCSLADWAD